MTDILGGLLSPKKSDDKPRKTKESDAAKDDVPGQAEGAGLPMVDVGPRPLRVKTAESLDAICRYNDPPQLFLRGGAVVRVERDETGLPYIRELSEAAFRGELARCADFMTFVKGQTGGGWRHVSPPLDVVRDAMSVRSAPFPPLVGITESPVIRPDGRVVGEQGYDEETMLYYVPTQGFTLPAIPAAPTEHQVTHAIGVLQDVICDFPFEDDASRANALATMITPALRPLIDGNVPLALIDKPQAGTGATLYAEVVALIATGRKAAPMTAPEDDAAWRKSITAQLLGGATIIIVDNVDGKLWTPSLAAALTISRWKDRILGRSEMVTLPNLASWIATGNNISLGGDLPRRCYWVRMDAQTARPWQREGFRHPNLTKYVAENRGKIIAAILTLGRSWVLAGGPADEELPRVGGFESWVRVVGGVLHTAGVSGFLSNLDAMYEQADEDGPPWEAFLAAWKEVWPDKSVTTKDIRDATVSVSGANPQKASLAEALPDMLGDPDDKGFTRKLGWALSKREKRYYPNGMMVAKDGEHRRAVRWRVYKNGESQAASASEEYGEDEKLPF